MDMKKKNNKRLARKRRVRMRIRGKNNSPRLAVFKSNRFIYAQIIDDTAGTTIFSENSKGVKAKNKSEAAYEIGKKIAEKAIGKNIKKVVFDRANYPYHGRAKALAEGAREG